VSTATSHRPAVLGSSMLLTGGVNKRRSVDGSDEKLRLTNEESIQSDRRDVD
jgi:hypothetical protein